MNDEKTDDNKFGGKCFL